MDKVIKTGIAVCLVIQILACIVLIFKDNNVPLHWDFYGEIDAEASAEGIMILPLSLLLAVGVYWFSSRNPQSINLPPNVPDKDRAIALSIKLLGYVTLWVGLMTTYLTLSVMFGWPIGIGILIFILILIGLIINVIKQIYKKEP